jgi:hypothetical protein
VVKSKDNSALDFLTRSGGTEMKTWSKGIVAGLLGGVVILGSLPAMAEPYRPTINQRQVNQERRIYQGVRSGQVTPREFQRLEHQQSRINRTEARMRADGHLSGQERARLDRMQNHADRNIYQTRHNNFGRAPQWAGHNYQQRPYTYRQANYRPAPWRPGWR